MGVDLYMVPMSPNCRSVFMALKAGDVDCVNLKQVDMAKGENKTPEYLKMNPNGTVPALNDNGFLLCESRPVMCYLVEKYGKNESIYPKDPQKRAVINKWLYFDLGTMQKAIGDYLYPHLFMKAPLDPECCKKVCAALEQLCHCLEGKKFVCGDDVTVADFALAASISMLELVPDWDFKKMGSVDQWFTRMKALPYWDHCNMGLYEFKKNMSA